MSREGGTHADDARPPASVDVEALTSALASHPVALAVLFGSTARDDRHAGSDVDVAVEFDRDVDVASAVPPLLADVESALGGEPVDLTLLSDLEPSLGLQVVREGRLLVGDREHLVRFERRFERLVPTRPDESRRARLDAAVERAREAVGGDR